MNYQKIGQFIAGVLVFAAGGTLYKGNLPLQTSLIVIAILVPIAIFFLWAGMSLEDRKQKNINIAKNKLQEEAINEELKGNSIPDSMKQIIINFSLEMPKTRDEGVKSIADFVMNEISRRSIKVDSKTDKDTLIDKGYFFFSIHQHLSQRFRTIEKYDYDFFEAFLINESSTLSPVIFISNINGIQVDLETLHNFSKHLENIVVSPNEKSIDNLVEFYKSFKRELKS
ncbi:hypothetical protein ACMAZA_04345 [Pseudothioglobus sp. nBUS_23]|uniref:hypothetical protein n=1 Tax=Pseudothioglobus sp. nBUS_23 TaxID=3395318 RepID=UPI003EB82CBE